MGGDGGRVFYCNGGRIGNRGASNSRPVVRVKRPRVVADADGASAMIAPNIIEVKWFTGKGSVGVVLIKTEYAGLKAYIGVGLDVNEDYDAEFIARYGAKIPRHIAAAYFPKRIKDGVIYDGKADKRPKGRQDVGE